MWQKCYSIKAWYPMSKTLAEKAAWDYCKENGIDLVTILPSFIIGPNLPIDLCSTASDVLGLFKGNMYTNILGLIWLIYFVKNLYD